MVNQDMDGCAKTLIHRKILQTPKESTTHRKPNET